MITTRAFIRTPFGFDATAAEMIAGAGRLHPGLRVATFALDRDTATRLWDMSQRPAERYALATRYRRIP